MFRIRSHITITFHESRIKQKRHQFLVLPKIRHDTSAPAWISWLRFHSSMPARAASFDANWLLIP
jgi:hypothetical protein